MSLKYRHAMLVVVFAAGCSVWRPLPGAVLARPATDTLDRATVSLRDGTKLELEDAVITPDSIVGLGQATSARVALARSDVAGVETRNTDPFTTFVAGVFAGAVSLWLIAVANSPRT